MRKTFAENLVCVCCKSFLGYLFRINFHEKDMVMKWKLNRSLSLT